jgi:hypothetical protein
MKYIEQVWYATP